MPCSITLGSLHRVLQEAMEWDDAHLHEFTLADRMFGVPEAESDVENENAFELGALVTEARWKFEYVYDFGDNWTHDILVEKILALEANAQYPRCIGGKRAAPPDDCGGVGGYADMLEAIRNPSHEDHDSTKEWLGEDFDPEAFDPEVINRELAGLR